MNRRATLRLALMEQLLYRQRAGEWWHHSYTYDPTSSNRKWTRDGGHSRNAPLPPGCIPVDMRGDKSVTCERRQGAKKQWRRGKSQENRHHPCDRFRFRFSKAGQTRCFANHKLVSGLNYDEMSPKQVIICLHCQTHLYLSISLNMIGSVSDWSVFVDRKMRSLFAAHLFIKYFVTFGFGEDIRSKPKG